MNDQPLISIIVPVYNVEKYVGACIDSILNQSYKNLELVLVDDGSTDRSGEICDDYARQNSNVKVIHQTTGGPSVSRNVGIDAMNGKYVVFVDSDDVIHSETIAFLYNLLIDNNADISTISLASFNNNEKLPRVNANSKIKIYEPGKKAVKSMLYQRGYIDNSPCGKLFKVSLFRHYRFPEGVLYEDLATIPLICLYAKKIVTSTATMYFYRAHLTSILGEFSLQRYDVLDVADELVSYMKQHQKSLVSAAQSRKFSANMNILYLMIGNGIENEKIIARCWENIKKLRKSIILNPRVRIKNKIGALLSYIGLSLLLKLFAQLKIKSNRYKY